MTFFYYLTRKTKAKWVELMPKSKFHQKSNIKKSFLHNLIIRTKRITINSFSVVSFTEKLTSFSKFRQKATFKCWFGFFQNPQKGTFSGPIQSSKFKLNKSFTYQQEGETSNRRWIAQDIEKSSLNDYYSLRQILSQNQKSHGMSIPG